MSKEQKKFQLDSLGYHEALDRTHLILCNIDDFLLDHNVINMNKKLRKKVEKASELLADVYQSIGNIEFEKFNK